MTPEQIEQERAAFEAWILKEYDGKANAIKRCNEGYSVYQVNDKWKGWLECARQTGWISVADRLPNESGNCLVVCINQISGKPYTAILYYVAADQTFRPAGCGVVLNSRTTHWQPLPQPPKGDPE